MKVPNHFKTMHRKQTSNNVSTHRCWLMLLVLLFASMGTRAEDSIPAVNPDTITDENFVTASLLLASPGDMLYACAGHCALRMQCPTHKLDYVFSYESENYKTLVFKFLAGQLKMGMFAVPTQEYLDFYRKEERGVTEYILNLPIEAKRNLWRVLDNHVMEGVNLSFDYLVRGCAHSTLMMIKEGLDTIPLQYGPWPEKYEMMMRRELLGSQLDNALWHKCFLHLLGNGVINDDCSIEDKVVVPIDLKDVLLNASVCGNKLVTEKPKELLPCNFHPHTLPVTPLMVGLVILVLTIICTLLKNSIMDYVLLIIQAILGLFTMYLVFVSSLVGTESNWHLVPFNILPLLFWNWRTYWCLPYAIVLAIWVLAMILYPHEMTDTAYLLLSTSFIVSYVNIYLTSRNNKKYS